MLGKSIRLEGFKVGDLVMTIKMDQESLDMAMLELHGAIEGYPKVCDAVLKDINRYLVMSTHQTDIDECYIKVSVSHELYSLIELVYGIKLVDVTADDSKHKEFMGRQQ